jgi:hypothetical protein
MSTVDHLTQALSQSLAENGRNSIVTSKIASLITQHFPNAKGDVSRLLTQTQAKSTETVFKTSSVDGPVYAGGRMPLVPKGKSKLSEKKSDVVVSLGNKSGAKKDPEELLKNVSATANAEVKDAAFAPKPNEAVVDLLTTRDAPVADKVTVTEAEAMEGAKHENFEVKTEADLLRLAECTEEEFFMLLDRTAMQDLATKLGYNIDAKKADKAYGKNLKAAIEKALKKAVDA